MIKAGGHSMGGGFTIETEKIIKLEEVLEKLAETTLHDGLLTRLLKIDCEIPFGMISQELYDEMQQLAPFGMANPEPIFVSRDVIVEEIKVIGREKKHLKLLLSPSDSPHPFHIEALAFGMAEESHSFKQ